MGDEILVTAVSGGVTYTLSDVCDFRLEAVDGLGLANIDRQSIRFPGVDGDQDRGHYVNPRFILLTWQNILPGNKHLWDLRRHMAGIFRPRDNSPIMLTFYFPDGFVASSDVNLVGTIDNDRLDTKTQRAVATLKAGDPRLYNPDMKTVAFNLLTSDGGWDVEEAGATAVWADDTGWDVADTPILGSGWNIGVSILNKTQVISYAQNVIFADVEYPRITITGQIENPVITNLTTGEKIDLTDNGGFTQSAGQQLVIDLSPTAKTIVNQDGVAVDEYLTSDSDLATFHLAYNGELLPDGTFCDGNNTILVQGENVNLATSVVITYYERYAGVG